MATLPMTDETCIRLAREASNDAIAAHNVAGILALVDDDFHITTGDGGFLPGKAAMGSAFAAQFAQLPDVVYVRTPETVKVSKSALLAFESGAWVGTWTEPHGPVRTGGRYSAAWHKRDGTWKIRAEVFVTLY